ncbi:MAG TPA: SRPBCC domain-containing protein [Thermoanaerobaculia bacterium]|jgi:activator of HSP90 ATPase|nr:SRPBCC domain-containing protein [Thermoanaerobaculia bacterium]
MTKTVHQVVALPASPAKLYSMYLDPKAHGAFTGMPVDISAEPGSTFSAFGGAISGRILLTVPGRLIVQAWRSTNFRKGDPDSILVLAFSGKGKEGRIEMTHVNVSDRDAEGVRKGWKTHYWTPWRKYLKK